MTCEFTVPKGNTDSPLIAGIAQLAEQPIRNRQVPSPSLGIGSSSLRIGSAPGSGLGSAIRLWMM